MGNSSSKRVDNNFAVLVESIRVKDVDNTKLIIENSFTDFSICHDGLGFYHYLVIYAPYYDRINLKKLCDIIYDNRHKFGNINQLACTQKYIKIQKNGSTYNTSYTDSCGYHSYSQKKFIHYTDIYRIKGLDAMSLCLELKTKFIKMEKLNDHLDIVIDLLKKLKDEHPKKSKKISKSTNKPNEERDDLICSVCMSNKKNIYFESCRHICVCESCVTQLDICPLCRVTIGSYTTVFI